MTSTAWKSKTKWPLRMIYLVRILTAWYTMDHLKKLMYIDEATYPSALREVDITEAGMFRRSMYLIITKSRNICRLCLITKSNNDRDGNTGELDFLVILSDGEKLCAYSYHNGSPVWQLAGNVSSLSGAGVAGINLAKNWCAKLIFFKLAMTF